MRPFTWLDQIRRDLRFGGRQLVKYPGFAFIIMLTLGVGIGVNAALFSVVNGLLLRPLPVKDPKQLAVLATQVDKQPIARGLSYPDFLDHRQESRVFSDLLGYYLNFAGFATADRAERILVSYVTGNYFSMLGLQAGAGRLILPEEGRTAGADPVIVLGHDYWQRRFAGDPSVIGRTVSVNSRPFTVVGVTPQRFQGLLMGARVEAYMPLAMEPRFRELENLRDTRNLRVLGRLRPGVSLAEAETALAVVDSRLARQYPQTNRGATVYAFPERLARPEPEVARVWPIVISIFMALVGLVLLVACFNIANLLLVRATVRRGETAVRLAMGASRGQLVRQLLAESLLLALAGGVMGVLIALGCIRLLESIPLTAELPIAMDFGLDWRVLGYVLLLVLASSVLFGLAPALQGSRGSLSAVLYERSTSGAGGGGRHRLRSALVVLQIAVSLILLATAGLFVRSLGKARTIDLGFAADDLLIVSLDTGLLGYGEERTEAFFRDLQERAETLPGVRSAALAYSVPMGHYDLSAKVAAEGRPPVEGEAWPVAGYNAVDPRYLETLGIPLLRGRGFTEQDDPSSQRVAIVNETMAARLWPGEEALGRRLVLGPEGPVLEVVGVARDAKYGFLFEPPQSFFYVPLAQEPKSLRVLHLATSVAPESLAEGVRRLVHDLDPALPAFNVQALGAMVHNDVNGMLLPRVAAGLAGLLGFFGLFLAAVGIYGVVSFMASRRTHEIGIRMALGAERRSILTMVIRQGLRLALIGLAVGLALTVLLARSLTALLYGVAPTDPVTFAGVGLLLTAVALLACLLPARRASRTSPMVALRYE